MAGLLKRGNIVSGRFAREPAPKIDVGSKPTWTHCPATHVGWASDVQSLSVAHVPPSPGKSGSRLGGSLYPLCAPGSVGIRYGGDPLPWNRICGRPLWTKSAMAGEPEMP